MGSLGQAEGGLRATLGHLFAVAEDNPDLNTLQTFQQLQTRISALENAIADRREFYNASVNVNNVRIEQFPASLPGKPLARSLSATACCWHAWRVRRKNSRDEWDTVESGRSVAPFPLIDDTGPCLVMPEGAEVLSGHMKTWREGGREYTEWRLFLLANELPERIGLRYRWWGWGHLALLFVLGGAGLWLLRLPGGGTPTQ